MSEVQRLWTRMVEGDAPESAGGRHDARDWQERTDGPDRISMRRRAERLGARFDIKSRPGGGTAVRLEVPQHRVH